MRLSTLIRLWIWVTLMAIAALVVLGVLDSRLKAATGFGVVDLQGMSDAMGYKRTLAAWIAREHSVSVGFDYLFMPLYAISFYFSAMIAREAFTPKKGVYRRTMDYLGYVPFVGAIADATENALEYSMLTGGATDGTASAAFLASNIKWTCAYVGMGLLLAAIAGVVKLWWPRKEDADA